MYHCLFKGSSLVVDPVN